MECPVCSNKTKFFYLYPNFCNAHNNLCDNCGQVFIDSPSDMSSYYKENGYFIKSPNKGLRTFVVSKPLLRELGFRRLKEMESLFDFDFSSKSILDIGCAYGGLLNAVREKYGAKVLGIEPSSKIAEMGESYFGIKILPVLLEELESIEKFEYVFCCHTLEHVNNPSLFLKKILNLLCTDGILYLEVPNIMKPSGGFDLNTFLYSEHLNTFNERSLEMLLKSCGFEVLSYNSDNFLRFLAKKAVSAEVKPFISSEISPQNIKHFLKDYKESYSWSKRVKVFLNKVGYLALVIKSKISSLV